LTGPEWTGKQEGQRGIATIIATEFPTADATATIVVSQR
jgi:hypothetical protein